MAKLPVKKPATSKVPVREYIQEYVRLRDEKKKLEARMSQISEALKAVAEEKGQKDDKGSFYFEHDNFMVGKQARKTITFDVEKATKFFRKKGFPECIDTIEQINMEAVEELLDSGDITLSDLEKITNTNITYSIDIKPVEKVTDEVTETEVKPAKKKGKLLRGTSA